MTGRHSGVITRVQTVVHFVKARPMNSCVFSAIYNDMGSDKRRFYNIQKCAGYQGAKYWHVFCNWEMSIKFSLLTIIFTCLTACMMTSFSYDWPIWVMFFSDLNLGLQGLSATICNVWDRIETMIKKLKLFSVCINNTQDNTQVFPSLYDFLCKWTQAYRQCQMWYSEAPH